MRKRNLVMVGILLTDSRYIAPCSIPRYLTPINNVISDVPGRTVLGSINSVSSNVLNTAHGFGGVTYAIRDNSELPRSLTQLDIQAIYSCPSGGGPSSRSCRRSLAAAGGFYHQCPGARLRPRVVRQSQRGDRPAHQHGVRGPRLPLCARTPTRSRAMASACCLPARALSSRSAGDSPLFPRNRK